MSPVFRFFRDNPGYLPMFILGVVVSAPYPAEHIHSALEVVGILMLVALFASLLVPFAAFSLPERRFKLVLQNAPLAAFGAYALEVAYQPTAVKVVLMVCAMGMHISYWSSGIHSRAFRLDQFRWGYASRLPDTTTLIASLNGTGRSELGDGIVRAVLECREVDGDTWEQVPDNFRLLVNAVQLELRGGNKVQGPVVA